MNNRLTAMVLALLANFSKDEKLTINISVHGQNDHADLTVSEFNKDEAGRFLVDSLSKAVGKRIGFEVSSEIKPEEPSETSSEVSAVSKAEEEQEQKPVIDLEFPFMEKIPDECWNAWSELLDTYQTLGMKFAQRIYLTPRYHKYGECKIFNLFENVLNGRKFTAQKIKSRNVFIINGKEHFFDQQIGKFDEYSQALSRAIKCIMTINGFSPEKKENTLKELTDLFGNFKFQPITLNRAKGSKKAFVNSLAHK